MLTRIEKDEFGEMELPLNAYYGISTLRNKNNFEITKIKVHKQMIKSLAIAKKACALANMDADRLSEEQARSIAFACDEVINGRFNNQFITDAIQGASANALNMNMNEVVANRANEMLGGGLGTYEYIDPIKHVNLFQTSSDIIPTAAKHAILVLAKSVSVELKKLLKCFNDKSKKYKKVYKVGRSHLQDSMPVSFGQIFSAMASTLERDLVRFNQALEELYQINLGAGTLGVAWYSDDDYVKHVVDRFNEFTKMEFTRPSNLLDESRNMDEFVNISHALKLMAINLSKTATDIRLMASGPDAGFNELILPKAEPSIYGLDTAQGAQSVPEIVNQVCFQIIGKDTTITFASEHGQMEVNAFGSIIYPNLFDSLDYLERTLQVFRTQCVEGLEVNELACIKAINNSNARLAGLLSFVDYNTCVEILVEASQKKLPVEEVIQSRPELDSKKLISLLNIDTIVKNNK